VRCTGCGRVEDRGGEELPGLPRCAACAALLRPDVVWFHEPLPGGVWQEAAAAALRCQCFLVAGTSAVVYPAASLVELARESGAAVIEVNLQPTEARAAGDVGLYGPAGVVLPRLLERLGM
jgi:NAD-dependent deacetylase